MTEARNGFLFAIGDITRIIIGVVAGLLISLSFLLAVSDQPSHDQLNARLERIERALVVTNCLIVAVEVDERADCLVNGENE